jgi:NAD(P)-dependent dehydrogenase (short-subunit alcohol dehydrogenase family)
MKRDLKEKRVVITGAASGLGRSLSLVLARRNCRIGVVDINTERARETLDMVVNNGGSGEIYETDVSVAKNVETMAEHFFQTWGGVDLLVNNAGVAVTGYVGNISLKDWEWLYGVNFWGMLYGCHSFIPRMKSQGGGYIMNVASSAGILCSPEMAPYNTSKAAIISLSETLYAELAPFNIGVTALCPMFFKTNLIENTRSETEMEQKLAEAAFNNARITSDEVAEAAIKAVEKGRLYCIPQFSGKFHWVMKRLNPHSYYRNNAALNRKGWLIPMMYWMARKGMV